MTKRFKEASGRGEALRLNEDELAFHDALMKSESSVCEFGDETLARLRWLVKWILRKYKYPQDQQEEGEVVLRQAEMLCEVWV